MLESAAAGDAAAWTRITAACDPALVERASRSFALTWLPIGDHMHLCNAIFDVLGAQAFVDLCCNAFAKTIQSPMLQGVFGALRRLGGDPAASLIRSAPRIYEHITRDIGTMSSHIERPGTAVIEIHDYPPDHRFEVWLAGTLACVQAGMHAVTVAGEVDVSVESADLTTGNGTYRIHWSAQP